MLDVRQFKLNIPNDVKDWLEQKAASNMRSQGSEIVLILRQEMERNSETKTAPHQA